MAAWRSPVLVRNDPFSSDGEDVWLDEATQANRTVMALLMSWRVSGLVTGVAAVVAGRRRYRSQAVAVGQLVGVCAESVWLARHFSGHGYRLDRRARTVDLVTAVAALLAGRGNLAPEDRWTWIDWVPWSFATNAVAGRAVDVEAPVAGALGATVIIGTGVSPAAPWTDRVVNAAGMAAHFAAAKAFVRQIRRGGARIEAARSGAIDEGRRLAVEQERSRQLRFLHDSALQTLEAVGTGRFGDLPSIRMLAEAEARRLGDELEGTAPRARPLGEELEALVVEHARRGLAIDLRLGNAMEPPAAVLLALRDACNEALVNVGKHAGTGRAAIVVEDERGGIRVTVEDEGGGFDPLLGTGFGTSQSIAERMAEVGGCGPDRIGARTRDTGASVGTGVITVAIVDDHPVYRQGLAMAVDRATDLQLAGEAKSIEDFDKLDARADVVLLDLHLPGIEGSAGVAHVCDQGYRVLVVSAAGTPDDVVDAIAAGAAGYLTKETDAEEITSAVRVVAGGETYVSPTLASYLLRVERSTAQYKLTKRERDVLALVAAGEKDQDIAVELSIAITTVHSHLERIRDKTGARRRAELTNLAHRLGIGPRPDPAD